MRPLSRTGVVASLVLAVLLADGCNSATGPRLIGEGTRILFIGNSHTYVNDVPGILQALADSGLLLTKPGCARLRSQEECRGGESNPGGSANKLRKSRRKVGRKGHQEG